MYTILHGDIWPKREFHIQGFADSYKYIILSYLCCLNWLVCSDVFLLWFSSSCVPYVASFSGLSIFDYPFGILWRLYLVFVSQKSFYV
jgi:hypothetical protein